MKIDINENLFAQADSLVDKVLSSARIKRLPSNFLIPDGRDTGVSLTDFAETLKRKNAEVPDNFLLYLMLLILHPAWFSRKMPKKKREGAGFLSRSEKQ